MPVSNNHWTHNADMYQGRPDSELFESAMDASDRIARYINQKGEHPGLWRLAITALLAIAELDRRRDP